jgi:hypothetical protein
MPSKSCDGSATTGKIEPGIAASAHARACASSVLAARCSEINFSKRFEDVYRRLSDQAKESKIAFILLRPDLSLSTSSSCDLRLQHHDK